MKWLVLKVREHNFPGDDGRVVTGKFVYLAPAEGEAAGDPRRVFVNSSREKDFAYFPKQGDSVYLFESGGRVQDFIKA